MKFVLVANVDRRYMSVPDDYTDLQIKAFALNAFLQREVAVGDAIINASIDEFEIIDTFDSMEDAIETTRNSTYQIKRKTK